MLLSFSTQPANYANAVCCISATMIDLTLLVFLDLTLLVFLHKCYDDRPDPVGFRCWFSTPFMHGSHDVGMAFDLELKQFINRQHQIDGSQLNANITLPGNGWSIKNAVDWTENFLPHTLRPDGREENNQRDALRQFLQLYALSADSGTRTALATQIVNGADKSVVLKALFGDGTQATGLVSQVHIGGDDAGQNKYATGSPNFSSHTGQKNKASYVSR